MIEAIDRAYLELVLADGLEGLVKFSLKIGPSLSQRAFWLQYSAKYIEIMENGFCGSK